MRRYEKYTKEEIVDMFEVISCKKCPCYDTCKSTDFNTQCVEVKLRFFKEKIKMKPRIELIKSVDDLKKAREEHLDFCRGVTCSKCYLQKKMEAAPADFNDCFIEFMAEEVEA